MLSHSKNIYSNLHGVDHLENPETLDEQLGEISKARMQDPLTL